MNDLDLLTIINQHLSELLKDEKSGLVKDAMEYSLLSSGKRIRALLLLTVLKAYGKDIKPYLNHACAIEMIHTYSLIHDDLPCMDDDDLRRGLPTCHKRFDEAIAVLAGDALLNKAYEVMLDSAVEPILNIKLMKLLANHSGQKGMIYGQQQDYYYENNLASLEELKDIHLHKTAKLIQVPLMMAGLIVNQSEVAYWEEIGEALGLVFQIQDDLLDVLGNEEIIGKKTGTDSKLNKSTYVSLLGIEKTKEEIAFYYQKAINCLTKLQINDSMILNLFEEIMRREY